MKALSILLVVVFATVLYAEVRVMHWEHEADPAETPSFKFYYSTNLTAPRLTWKRLTNTTPYVVVTNGNVTTWGTTFDLPPGLYYVFGIASNLFGESPSDMSNVAMATNSKAGLPLRLQISSALVFSNDTILLRMSNKP